MNKWRPIETAPRDGRWFVILVGDRVEAGRYNPTCASQYDHVSDGLYRKTEIEIYEWEGFNNFHAATGWAPVPAIESQEGRE